MAIQLKPDIDLQKVAKIQRDVNDIFCAALPSKGDKPFREFNAHSTQDKKELITTLMNHSTKGGLESLMKFALSEISGKKLNPELMQAALAVILTHSKDAQDMGVVVPPLAFSAQFRVRDDKLKPTKQVDPGTLKGPAVLSYFREDYDLNQHHYHWHHVYPYSGIRYYDIDTKQLAWKRTIIRQGELFLYMHSQMLARYNAELLAWDMDLVHPFDYDESPLQEYIPPDTLTDYSPRSPAGQGWYETHNPLADTLANPPPNKSEMLRRRNNLRKALVNGYIKTNEEKDYPLTKDNGTNVMGIIIEAISEDLQYLPSLEDDGEKVFPNYSDYKMLHNEGHDKFSEIGMIREQKENSEYEYKFGVMSATSVAVRDYIFWVWHRHIDDFRRDMVRKFKHSPSLNHPEAKIVQLQLVPRDKSSKSAAGEIATYLGPPDPNLNEVDAKLGHEPYQWIIKVKSERSVTPSPSNPQKFTVRIFIVPKILLQDQFAWIEMDKFNYSLDCSEDTIRRDDKDSSVAAKIGSRSNSRCSCGWPQTMMLPLGKTTGMDYVAFAILTDDELGKDPYTPAISFCGAQDGDYPDTKGMGYPFDHLWAERVNSSKTVEDIIKDMPHAKLWDFKIKRVDPPLQCPQNETVSAFEKWMHDLKLPMKFRLPHSD